MSVSFSAVVGRSSASGCERPRPQVGERLRVGGQHQLRQVLLGVQRDDRAPSGRAAPGRPRTGTASQGRAGPGDGAAVAPAAAAAPAGGSRRRPAPAAAPAPRGPGRSSAACRVSAASEPSSGRTCASGTTTAVSVSRRRPARPLGRGQHGLGRRRLEQVVREPLEQSLAHPPGRVQLVGVAGHAGRGQLVDVGEDQLGEAGQGVGRRPRCAPPSPTSPARRPARRSGTPPAARRPTGRCGPRRGRAGRRPRPPARPGCGGPRRGSARPAR